MATFDAPINRNVVNTSTPILRLILGIIFVGYSAGTTITYFADDLSVFFKAGQQVTIAYVDDRFWYGFLLALVIFFGEVVTSEKAIGWYLLFLAPDTFYTARQIQQGFQNALIVLLGTSPGAQALAVIGSWVIGLIVGYLIAKWGEVLIFGRSGSRARRKAE
jgi:hypothetical protein